MVCGMGNCNCVRGDGGDCTCMPEQVERREEKEHEHEFKPLYAAITDLNFPDFLVYYHCVSDDCDEGTIEVEKGYEV